MSRIIVHVVNALLLGVLFVGSVAVWSVLPDHIPMHMNLNGVIDSWTERTIASWFALPMVALILSIALYVMGGYIARRPQMINLPNKKDFLALLPEQQASVLRTVQGGLQWIVALTNLLMLMIQYDMYRAAMGSMSSSYGIATVLVVCIATPLLSLAVFVRIQSRISAMKRENAADPAGSKSSC